MLKTIIIVLLLLLIVAAVIGFYSAKTTLSIPRQTLDGARRWQEDHYDISWYDELEKTDYTVSSYDGYLVHVQFLHNDLPADQYVIISHGYTDNRFGALKYAKMYLDLGFHVIIYDLRGHGLNEETFCTYSVREARDLLTLIEDTRSRYEGIKTLGIHGESLGAATSVACLKYHPQIAFVVADCGFSDIFGVLENGLKASRMPAGILKLTSVCAKIRYGFSLAEMRPIDSLKGNEIPVLFIHGANDSFILPDNSERMQAETSGYSELHLIPDAGHAESALKDPETYAAVLREFLQRIKDNL